MRVRLGSFRCRHLFGVFALSLLLSAHNALAAVDGVILIPVKSTRLLHRPLLFLRTGSNFSEIQPQLFSNVDISTSPYYTYLDVNGLYASYLQFRFPSSEVTPASSYSFSNTSLGYIDVPLRRIVLSGSFNNSSHLNSYSYYFLRPSFGFWKDSTPSKCYGYVDNRGDSHIAYLGYFVCSENYKATFYDQTLDYFSSFLDVTGYFHFMPRGVDGRPVSGGRLNYTFSETDNWGYRVYWFSYSNIPLEAILDDSSGWGWWFDSSSFVLNGNELVGVQISSLDNSSFPPAHGLDRQGKPKSDFEENWKFDRDLGKWVSRNGYLDGSQPPSFKGGLTGNWVFGVNPNGAQHSDNNETPEWYWDGLPYADDDSWKELVDAWQQGQEQQQIEDAQRRAEVNAWLQMIEANTAASSRSLQGLSSAIQGVRGDVSDIASDTSRIVGFGSELVQVGNQIYTKQTAISLEQARQTAIQEAMRDYMRSFDQNLVNYFLSSQDYQGFMRSGVSTISGGIASISSSVSGIASDVGGIASTLTSLSTSVGSGFSDLSEKLQSINSNHSDLKAFLSEKFDNLSVTGQTGGEQPNSISTAISGGVQTLGGKLDTANTQRQQLLTDVNGLVQNAGQSNDYLSQIKDLISSSNQKQEEQKQNQEQQISQDSSRNQKLDDIKQNTQRQNDKTDEVKQKLDDIKDKIDDVKDTIGGKLEVDGLPLTPSLDDSLSSVQEAVRDNLSDKLDDMKSFSDGLEDGHEYGLFSMNLRADPEWISYDTYSLGFLEFEFGLNWDESRWSWLTQYRPLILLIERLSLWLFTLFNAFKRLSNV